MIRVIAKCEEDYLRWTFKTTSYRMPKEYDAIECLTKYVKGCIDMQGVMNPSSFLLLKGCEEHEEWEDIKEALRWYKGIFPILQEVTF